MSRSGKMSGERVIEDDKDCSPTFLKQRDELFEAAVDLSTVPGVKLAVVVESENGKFSAFGAPAVQPVVEAFLSGNAPMESDASKEENAKLTNLQNELLELEKALGVEKKREELIARTKEIQGSFKMYKYFFGKIEGLDINELYDMQRELSRIHETLCHGNEGETSGDGAENTRSGKNLL